MFSGSITALITPFKDGNIDESAYEKLINWQIEQGTNGLVPCGTTGESPTLSEDEQLRLIEIAVKTANGSVHVIAGTGSNDTKKTISMTQKAADLGIDAALVVTPYYNKPTQNGLYHHYKAIHDETDVPIIIYSIPGRCNVDMSLDTMAKLAYLPRIIGVKDATGDLARPARTAQKIGNDFCMLSGEDPTTLAFLVQGGHGCISVTSNIAPKLCADLQTAWHRGDIEQAQSINQRLTDLNEALFLETNPIPVKYAASLLGLCSATTRSPLWEPNDNTKQRIKTALKKADIL
jgi:4-hydroxy-tetrahydrodipicolinate synthase